MRNPHIVRTLPILHFFGLFQIFWGIIWLLCCLNKFVTLRRWSNDIQKNRNPKILKNSQVYEEFEESSHSSYPLNSPLGWSVLNFLGIIRLGCCLNRFVTLRRWSNDMRKNRNAKILKNSQRYEECEESLHCLYLPNSPLLLTF